ncbi:HU family DNA-binding protein [Rhodobacter calidifons]|uniref:DNA-binding protein n=1 Tax=Rhodobacter calidifons TaxID=2715277 RepID=A0ABX0G9W5_9RHOB|nr:HU family DNA-binding protein [Rhodobacter calidifons]NHB77652.1 hypothetical protein [Rhodobacter calidifons]
MPRTPKDSKKSAAKADKPAKAPAPEPAEKAVTPALKVVETAAPEALGGAMKLKDLVDSVSAATGGRKPEVKKTVEATLAALGEALARGRALTVPPLGKLRVVKNKGPALTVKLRRADGAKAAGLALADDGEDG